jgi:DNA adenine methylase/adenine-specific DNA-methyltransferase
MGNKYKLLKQLIPLFPQNCEVFYDMFGGSGVVSMNYHGETGTIYNEFNHNIYMLAQLFKNTNPDELDVYFNNRISTYELERCSIKAKDRVDRSGYERRRDRFNKFREDYNNSIERDYRDLFLLSCYSINHLIRFNQNSEFNASSGADSYNEKNYKKIWNMYETFKTVTMSNENVFDLDFDKLVQPGDFVYCDPPYTNTTAVYNEKRAFGGWTEESDKQLFSILERLHKRGIKWGLSNVMVNRGKENTHLMEWCAENNWYVYHLNRNYNPFSRGNSDDDEVYICNYCEKWEDLE